MKKRNIGNLSVSEIGMGCMGFSHGYGQIPDEQYSIEAIRDAYHYGCTFFDTAEVYGPNLLSENKGHNERIVGEAIKEFRKDVVLATKLHLGTYEISDRRTVYEAVKTHLEESLKRLQTDYADLYYLHRINPDIPVEDVADAMGRLIKEGLIRGWGLSQVDVDTIEAAHKVTPVTAVQNIYNIVERGVEDRVIPFCEKNGIGLVAFSPTSSGLLSGKIGVNTEFAKVDDVRNFVPQLTKENIERNQPIVDLLARFAGKKGATPVQISLAWMVKKYPNVVPIPGSKNKARILENLKASEVEMSDAFLAEFEEELAKHEIHGHRGFVEDENTRFIRK